MVPRKLANRRRRRHQVGFTLIETLVIILVVGVLAALSAPSFTALMDSIRVDQTIVEVRTALQSTQRQAIRGTQVCSVMLQIAPEPDRRTDNQSRTGSSTSASGPSIATSSNSGSGSQNSKGNNTSNGNNNVNNNGNNNTNGNNGSSTSPGATGSDDHDDDNDKKNTVTGTCLTSGEPDLPRNVSMATNIVGSSPSGSSSPGFEIKYGVLGGAEFAIRGLNTSATRDSSGKIIAFVPERQNGKKKCIAISSTLGLTRVGTYVGETDPDSITQTGVCTALEWNKQ